ncbi:MAG TPA: chitobiase/beta-hexosaminidase C-terminal domain-containing protein, partial [Povalibacter sp.]
MKSVASLARLVLLALLASGLLGGCKKADAPVFTPLPGTYTGTQYVAMSTPTFGGAVLYTTDGSNPNCEKASQGRGGGTVYSAPVAISSDTTLKAVACALARDESVMTVGKYVIKAPEVVATPQFSPAAGTYVSTQSVTIRSATTDAVIHYTSDGTAATCASGAYAGAITVAESTTLSAIACATGKTDSAVATAAYVITPPAAAPTFTPAAGAYTSVQQVAIASATAGATFRYTTDGTDPTCGIGQSYGAPIEVANSLTLKAVACAGGYSDSLVTSAGYDITLPPEEPVWHSVDIDNAPSLAVGLTSTNEDGNAVNVSGRGKFESTAQVFRFVYASVTGDFVMTARLDGVDFAGGASNQGRAALLFTPDFTQLGNSFIYGSVGAAADGTYRRGHRLGAVNSSNSTLVTVAGTGPGARYLKLARVGNKYEASVSLDGGTTYNTVTGGTFTVTLPEALYLGFAVNSASTTATASATFSDVHVVDAQGNQLIGPDEFTGDIGSGTGGGTPGGGGTSSPTDISQGATPPEPPLVSGSVSRY